MLTYKNDPALKEMFIKRFAEHRAADDVIQGTGFDNGRGCFIGCTMNAYDHESFGNQIADQWLAHLADAIFEGLPKEDAPQFGTDLLEAIPVGVDIEPVRWKLTIWRHKNQIESLKNNKEEYAIDCVNAIQGVIRYCESRLYGTAIEESAWSAARSAWLAARSARSATESATWLAARSAAESAWLAARSAARSATESATWLAARSAAESLIHKKEAEMLIKLLKECK